MNKKGFTLIELMVVVVIIGILAAVAVPKLFGMIAKSKASEVGPAAGTYVKMQQAYISESMKMGNWVIIGYKGPGDNTAGSATGGASSETTNFKYNDAATGYDKNTADLSSEAATGWSAKNRAKLNDCDSKDDNWTVKVKELTGGAAGEAEFTAETKDTECAALTPTFATIGK